MEGKVMEIYCIGLFVNNMETMVKFYRDIIRLKTNWNGEPNADLESGNCRLIMFGRNDFEKFQNHLISKRLKRNNGNSL
jgi:catechol-2,3-dioxygenase